MGLTISAENGRFAIVFLNERPAISPNELKVNDMPEHTTVGNRNDNGQITIREIKCIFQSCRKLTRLTGRPFSPDGHLVGSLGEVVASDKLKLRLMPPATAGYDAIDKQGRRVEIKATTRNAIHLSSSGTKAERLVVVQISNDGDAEIVYNGPAAPAWEAAGKPQKNGQRSISLSKLKGLAK